MASNHPFASNPLWTAAADGLLLVDSDGTIRATNPALDAMFGYSEEELIGEPVERLIPTSSRERHVGYRLGYEDAPRPRTMAARQLLEGLRCDDTSFPAAISLSRMVTGEAEVTMAAVRDLTDRVLIEAEVARANRLRAIAEDHDRIASELHDTVIQQLFALGLSMQGLPPRIEDPDAATRVSDAVDTIDYIIAKIRTSIHGLKHKAIPQAGLRHQILDVVTEMEPTLECSPRILLQGDLDDLDDAEIAEHLLATLREALANVARHAAARVVTITVTTNKDVVLEVHDNGRGFPADVSRSGLANLAARARSLGGEFTVEPATPSGTMLRWRVPRGSGLD